MRRDAPLIVYLACAPLCPLASTVSAHSGHDPESVGWSRLELEATKLFITARSEVDLGRAPAAEVAAELIEPAGERLLQPSPAGSYLMAIRTTVLGQESRVRFLFLPQDGRALQRSELSTSKKRHRHRTYRYAEGGVHSRTLTPAEGESALPFEKWSQIAEKRIAFPRWLSNDVVVTEPAALLYSIPAAALAAPGDALVMHVFSRGHVNPVDVAVQAEEMIRVEYLEASAAGERAVRDEIEALRVAVRPRPLAEPTDRGGFKLLGLEGDIDLYLDPRSRAPLLVTGKIKIAGRVQLQLRRVVLR